MDSKKGGLMRNNKKRWIATIAMLWVPGFSVIVQAQSNPELAGIPGTLKWHNTPTAFEVARRSVLTISSGAKTDWFVDSFDGTVAKNAPILSFIPGDTYAFSTKVEVQFTSKWDAGALMLWADDHHWAKLSFELSPDKRPTMVTVVTRGLSDDCNSVPLPTNTVYLQIARTKSTYVFYYSTDGTTWNIIRTFDLKTESEVSLVFESQSPAGTGSRAVFSKISYSLKKIPNVYTGK
jgi:regulation of enolase protein 1 (concanavalin A-like superfamily)